MVPSIPLPLQAVPTISRQPWGPRKAGTALNSPSNPPGPTMTAGDAPPQTAGEAPPQTAGDAVAPPHEYLFFSSNCCERSRDLRSIASSRSCPDCVRESRINTSLNAGMSHQMGLCAQHPKPRHKRSRPHSAFSVGGE